jgi:hypothetical protein
LLFESVEIWLLWLPFIIMVELQLSTQQRHPDRSNSDKRDDDGNSSHVMASFLYASERVGAF